MKKAAATIQSNTECVGSRDMAKSVVRGAGAGAGSCGARSMVPIPPVVGKQSRESHQGHDPAFRFGIRSTTSNDMNRAARASRRAWPDKMRAHASVFTLPRHAGSCTGDACARHEAAFLQRIFNASFRTRSLATTTRVR
ncbi:hypothetical protein [Burkholderia sp. MSMB1835]|uniref:hypothetical protein n=1 Tax=Burkholderia sp. MSMB1835 TaxID=1637876 RepID=UPI0015D06BB7|nr:hypothetical protein [Burkholderia sp. MSMB1835]